MAQQTRMAQLNELLSTTQGKTYTVIVVTFLVVALLVSFAVAPAYISITNQLVKNDAKREHVEKLNQKETALRQLATQEETLRTEIDTIDKYFPHKQNDEFVVANMAKLAEKYTSNLNAISFGKAQAPAIKELSQFGNLLAVPVSMTFEGKLTDLEAILAHVESFPMVLSVKTVRYGLKSEKSASGVTETATGVYTLNLEAEYYFWND